LILSRIIFTYLIANNIKAFHRECLEIDRLLESLPKEEKEEKEEMKHLIEFSTNHLSPTIQTKVGGNLDLL
jgi:hypothetical protein